MIRKPTALLSTLFSPFLPRYATSLVVAGTSHSDLAEKLSNHLQCELFSLKRERFSNGETKIRPLPTTTSRNVIIVQSPKEEINNQLFELFLAARMASQSGARKTIAVVPTFPYARSDKTEFLGYPVGARFVCDAMQAAGINHVITVDLHVPQIEGFFSSSFSHVSSVEVWTPLLKIKRSVETVLVAPDGGAVKSVSKLSQKTKLPTAFINKVRNRTDNAIIDMALFGDVERKHAIIVDDMADSCGTILKAAALLKQSGASSVTALLTHGIFSNSAFNDIDNCEFIDNITITNTLNQRGVCSEKLQVLDISNILYERIVQLL